MAAAAEVNRQSAGFFRVILPTIPYQKKMSLPLKFVVMYGIQLSSTATLKLPNGAVWKIGVKKATDGRTAWFTKNWDQFIEHYSIAVGFFITFQYLGSSEFDVKIFNLTTCSINYPRPGGGRQPIGRGRASTGAQPISPNLGASSDDEEEDRCEQGEVEKLMNLVKESGIVTSSQFDRILPKHWMQCKKGVEEAILSKPPNRPCFLTLMTCALIRWDSQLMIPGAFVAEHIDDQWQSVKLRVQGKKKQWDVDLKRSDRSKTISMAVKSRKRFVDENGLGVGDVCLFQLVSPAEPVMEVTVFPAADE
ncbi:unnamed protein product [Linum tenue]|uniref:TF-B3 domain-containing protein n=1 Tax=Linum tenue TaxID=586396 RepID=A0AAV0QCR8_9ROSI|nr:unnamed protein product [Linum tenue]